MNLLKFSTPLPKSSLARLVASQNLGHFDFEPLDHAARQMRKIAFHSVMARSWRRYTREACWYVRRSAVKKRRHGATMLVVSFEAQLTKTNKTHQNPLKMSRFSPL